MYFAIVLLNKYTDVEICCNEQLIEQNNYMLARLNPIRPNKICTLNDNVNHVSMKLMIL